MIPKTNAFITILTDIVTTAKGDGCNIKIMGHLGTLALIVFTGFVIYCSDPKDRKFDFMAFGGGEAAIITATAAGQRLKDSTELQPPSPPGNP